MINLILLQIWNHPDILHLVMQRQKKTNVTDDTDLDVDYSNDSTVSTLKKVVGKGQPEVKAQLEEGIVLPFVDKKEQQMVNYDWVSVC